MLLHCPVAQADSVLFAKIPKAFAVKLFSSVRNEVFGLTADIDKSFFKYALYILGTGLFPEQCNTYAGPGEMVDNNTCPPAERPAEELGKGEPPDPEACCCRNDRQIDIPDMVGIFR